MCTPTHSHASRLRPGTIGLWACQPVSAAGEACVAVADPPDASTQALAENPDVIRASAGWLLHPQRAGAAMAMRPGELPKDAEGRVKSPYTLEMRARQSAQLFQALGSATSEALAKVAPEEKAALLGSIAELVRRDAKTDRFKREAALEPLAQIAVSALPGWCKDGEVAQRAAGAADSQELGADLCHVDALGRPPPPPGNAAAVPGRNTPRRP